MHLVDPITARELIAAGLGSFVFLLVTRRLGWLSVLSLFIVGQITAYYFTMPIAAWLRYGDAALGPIGFFIGLTAMLFWGGVLTLVQKLHDDPLGTITYLLRLWRGGNASGSITLGDGGKGEP